MTHPLFTSRTEEWATPQSVFDALDAEFHFTLDPASTDENAKCPKHFTESNSGLLQDWLGDRVFLNPPYGRDISQWMKKAATCGAALVVCLVHARTDTAWWHDWVMPYADEIRFVRGRLRFGDGKQSAPFPSCVVVYRPFLDRVSRGTPILSACQFA
jgi:site-specific DNA-methyltransferase (adenine-specific)